MSSDPAPPSPPSGFRFAGFPWWLPLCTAAAAALFALGALSTIDARWEAGMRLWVRDETRPAADYAALVDDPATLAVAAQYAAAPLPVEQLAGSLDVSREGATIELVVRAGSGIEADALARAVADAAVGESLSRFGAVEGMQVLGRIGDGPRQVGPRRPEAAALATAGGLLLGIAAAAALGSRRARPISAVAKVGRARLRPLAVLTAGAATAAAPESARRLADALEAAEGPATFAALGAADAGPAAIQAARALAGRGRHVAYLDARAPQMQVRRLHGLDAPPAPQPSLPPSDAGPDAPAPSWLAGIPRAERDRRERIARAARANAARFPHVIVLAEPAGAVGSAILVGDAGEPALDRLIAAARAEIEPRGVRVLGVALAGGEAEAEELAEVAAGPA